MKTKQIENITKAKEFMFAGNSTFTVVSKVSNSRYTFKIQKGKKDDSPHFVKFLNGSDNESSYMFIGTIFGEDIYRHSFKSPIKSDAKVVKTVSWILNVLTGKFDESKFKLIEFWHEGRCGRCGRKLTTPSSLKDGIGPSCSGKSKLIIDKTKLRNNKIDVILNS